MEDLRNRQAATPVILTLAIVALGWYLLMLLDPANIGHPAAYALLLIGEGIGIIQLLGVWLTIIVGKPEEKTPYEILAVKSALAKNPKLAGRVAVLVPVAGEPLSVIGPTLRAARDIRFPHDTYVLDDGKSDETKALASALGIRYLCRPDRKGWKAGNLNHALDRIECDYYAVFDSDHVARPEFLEETLPWMLADHKVAFIQTPQHLANRDGFVAGGSAETQDVFYRHIMTGKNRFNAAFCVGTNVLFRREAVRGIGGMFAMSHSEDIWTAYLLHIAGWKSVYRPVVLAEGQAPETVDGFLRQQFRWATGGFELLFRRTPLFQKTLTLDQKLQYMHTAMFFLTGFSVLIFYILPLLYVYLRWKPIEIAGGGGVWAVHFLPYFVLMFATVAHLMGHWPKWRTYVIAVGAFSAQMAACFAVLTGVKLRWKASGVRLSNIDHVKSIMLHLLLLFLSLAAIPVAVLREDNATMMVMMPVWLAWNSALLFALCRRAFPAREAVSLRSSVPALS